MSLGAIAVRDAQVPLRLRVLATIDREALGTVDRVSYDLYKRRSQKGSNFALCTRV